MSAPMLSNGVAQNMSQQPAQQRQPVDLQQMILVCPNYSIITLVNLISHKRANFLRKNPLEQKNPGELESLMKYISIISAQRQSSPPPSQQPLLTSFL